MRAPLGLLLVVGLAGSAAAQSPREAGEAWQADLAEAPPLADLAGTVRLAVQVGGSRAVGTAVLRTEVVERDGVEIYRVRDRMTLDLAGLGSARMALIADLRADLTALEVGLETEEPRGAGVVSRQRVALRRQQGRWVRTVTRGSGAPEVTALPDLPERLLVLTAPLGAGERLVRLAPDVVGSRLSLPGFDLETGQAATWRASIDEVAAVALSSGQRAGLRIERREGAARLLALRDREPGGVLRRLVVAPPSEGSARLILADPALTAPPSDQAEAVGAAVALLGAMARGETEQAAALLDVAALYRALGGDPHDAPLRRSFRKVLVRRLTDPAWLQSRGLAVPLAAVQPGDLVAAPQPGGLVAVSPRAAPEARFVLERVDGRWLVVGLPDG